MPRTDHKTPGKGDHIRDGDTRNPGYIQVVSNGKYPSVIDPVRFVRELWPDIHLYDRQAEILYSLRDCDETIAVAGNMLGKDFVAALGVLWFFITRSPCRVVTTSVDATQLEGVLWGEIRRFMQTAKYPLDSRQGGPLLVNHLQLRKVTKGQVCGISYAIGRVAAKGEGMLGHHVADVGDGIPRTLFVADEASGVDDESYNRADTWARRKLIIGNPYPCTNFFIKGVKQGAQKDGESGRTLRNVIRIRAEDSPNVRLGLAEKAKGSKPSKRLLIHGVLSYEEYRIRRQTWDPIRQCIGLDGEFYEGAEVLMYPPDWLNHAEQLADMRPKGFRPTGVVSMGVDPAEGGDSSCWSVVSNEGLIDLRRLKTPDTNVIPSHTIQLIKQYGIDPQRVCFDVGGGGKQHVDRLRAQGYPVRAIGFGEAPSPPPKRGLHTIKERVRTSEERYTYRNRRAEMYGMLREALDPSNERGFGIPAKYDELRRQLAPLPLLYDGEGRVYLPPKNKKNRNSKEENLFDMLGCSPDEADSLVLAVFARFSKGVGAPVGAIAI